MRRMLRVAGAVLLLSAVQGGQVAAQWNVARFDGARNRVYVTAGLDPAIVASVGYGRVIAVVGHDFQVAADFGEVAARLDSRDFRARLGVQTSLVHWRSLHLAGSATFITRGTENTIYRGLDFGADLTGALGFYRHRWFAAAEFGKDKAIITHVTHTEWYRTYFYPGAKDGWYLDAGGTFHYGVAAGLAIGGAELIARAGYLRTEDFNDLLPPMYVSVGVGLGF